MGIAGALRKEPLVTDHHSNRTGRSQMKPTVDFFFSFLSPYSYMAASQLGSLGAAVNLRPFDLMDLMTSVGNAPTTITCKPKGLYARTDLGRWAQHYGIPLMPSDIVANDVTACSFAVLAAPDSELALNITQALFRKIWGESVTLKDSESILRVLGEEGLATPELISRFGAEEHADELQHNTDEAIERGVFGAPTFFVGDQMFFGNDRLDFLRATLGEQRVSQ